MPLPSQGRLQVTASDPSPHLFRRGHGVRRGLVFPDAFYSSSMGSGLGRPRQRHQPPDVSSPHAWEERTGFQGGREFSQTRPGQPLIPSLPSTGLNVAFLSKAKRRMRTQRSPWHLAQAAVLGRFGRASLQNGGRAVSLMTVPWFLFYSGFQLLESITEISIS